MTLMIAVFMLCNKNKRNRKLKPSSQEVVNVSNQSTIFKLFETHLQKFTITFESAKSLRMHRYYPGKMD